MSNQSSPAVLGSLDDYLSAYQAIVKEHGSAAVIRPGRINLFGWDLEYLSAPNIASFIDALLIRRVNDFIPDHDRPLILDCGANIGFSVLNYRRQFPKSRIIAFEPDPRLTPFLKRNLQRNGADDVEVIEAAAWIRNGEGSFQLVGADGSRLVDKKSEGRESVGVMTIDLAEYLGQPVDLLKMDIEGAEYPVIHHLAGRMSEVKNVLIECHLNQNVWVPFGGLLGVLKNEGFELFLNSMGVWRDLIRQPELGSSRWEQYLLVAGRRGAAPPVSTAPSWLPFIGAEGALQVRAGREESAAGAAVILDTLKASAGIGAGRLGKRILTVPFVSENGRCWTASLAGLEAEADDPESPTRSRALLLRT